MKAFGIILIIAGIICIIMGGYGLITAAQYSSADAMGMSLDDALAFTRAFGSLVESEMTFGEQLQLFMLENRIALLIGGIVSTIVGIVLKRAAY